MHYKYFSFFKSWNMHIFCISWEMGLQYQMICKEGLFQRRWTWTGDFKCREVKTGFCRNRSMKTGSSGTLIGWKSGQTTYFPLWDRMEGAWLWTRNVCGDTASHWPFRSSMVFFLPFSVYLGRTILTARLNSLEDKLSRKGPRMSVEYNLFCIIFHLKLLTGFFTCASALPPPGGTLTNEEVPKSLYQPITRADRSRLSNRIWATPMKTFVPSTRP